MRTLILSGRHGQAGPLVARALALGATAAWGLDLDDAFLARPLAAQLGQIREALPPSPSLLVGRSYGAYLLLLVLLDLPPRGDHVLLLGPVLGPSLSGPVKVLPPRSQRFLRAVDAGSFPAPARTVVVTGALDQSCPPALARRFCDGVAGAELQLLPEADHHLAPAVQERALRALLEALRGPP
ncbi:MAG: hypothetical protein JXX28_04310 [Deltaproteobacteria bacterium]|nr:hypothetical protein [Deltaproteobacteria bacterium]